MDPYIADLKVKGKQLQIMYHSEGYVQLHCIAMPPFGPLWLVGAFNRQRLRPYLLRLLCGRVGLWLAGRRMEQELAGQQAQSAINKKVAGLFLFAKRKLRSALDWSVFHTTHTTHDTRQ
jgi:hypothetical protein